jgi:hypothetical protein
MRKLFNEIQNAETAGKADFTISQVFYNLLGEVIRFEGDVSVNSQPVPAQWSPAGDLISFNGQPAIDSERQIYQLIIRKRFTSDTRHLQFFWIAVTYYLLSGRLIKDYEYKILDGKFLAFAFEKFFTSGFKSYCRQAQVSVGSMYNIRNDIEKQPYTILKNSLIFKSLESELKGFDMVFDIKLLNLDIDFEALKGGQP